MDSTSSGAPRRPDEPGVFARLITSVIAWALARRVVRAYLLHSERRGAMLADSITYRALFSVFAGVLLGFSIAAIWLSGNTVAWEAIIAAVDAAVPGLLGPGGVVEDPASIPAPDGLSVAGVVSLIALVGAALGAISSLRTAVRTIGGVVLDDTFWLWVILRNLALAVGIGLSFIVAAGMTFAVGIGIDFITEVLGISTDAAGLAWALRVVSLLIVFALDAVLIFSVFQLLSGQRVSVRAVWTGASLGAVGLLVLQQLSSLFVGGATANPLLASFASLLALLIWLNLSAQVILIACAYITTFAEEERDRVLAREGARTFAQRRVQRARQDVMITTKALRTAEAAEAKERSSA